MRPARIREFEMNCNICELQYGPFCTTMPGNHRSAKTDPNCTLVRRGRTKVGDFMYCENHRHQFGPGTPYGILGWYSGRDY